MKVDDAVRTLTRDEAFVLLGHSLRVQIVDSLHEPDSAAGLARRIGATRQKVNYHLRELERAGLVERSGERRAGNLVESLYRAVARTFLVPPRLTWSAPGRTEAMHEQHSLERLVLAGERVQREATALLDRAAFDGAEIASLSVDAELRFGSEEERAEFLAAYLRAVGPLLAEHGREQGLPYRLMIAVYPDPELEEDA